MGLRRPRPERMALRSRQAGVGDSLGERGWEGVRDGCWRRQGAEGCQGASAGEMMDVMRCDRLLLKSFRQISKSGIAA